MPALAIVIPAHRPDFFRETLESLAAQSDRRFRVYVGDDAGPPEIGALARDAATAGLDLVYHRFDENLGGRSLTAHWNRCVALSSEPWVWLFADDDVMGPGCVAGFHDACERDDAPSVLRFDTTVIDAESRLVRVNPRHPDRETGVDFVYARLAGERHSYVVEYVFRREAYDRAGGFPDYPVAWCADDAAWFLFADERGILTVRRDTVAWRASGRNISTTRTHHRAEKLTAAIDFLRFVEREVMPRDRAAWRTSEHWLRARERWFVEQLRYPVPVGPALWDQALGASRGLWRASLAHKVATLGLWNVRAKWRALLGTERAR